jgi:hypothetical protein
MKRNFVLMAVFVLCTLSAAAQGNKTTPNFGGTWNLDVAKSQLGERSNIESQALTVTQTATTLKVETSTKRTPPQTVNPGGMPAGSEAGKPQMGGGGAGRGMGGGRFGGGDVPWTYGLEGKETKGETQGPMGPMPVALNAKFDGPKLNLSRSSTFNGPNGEVLITTKEQWQLSADGKTLTINAERAGMRGTESTVRVYTKKDQK